MKKRIRSIPVQVYLSDDEKFILDEKYKASGMPSLSAFLRHLLLYGYVYEIDYKELQKNNEQLARIGNNLNQIAKVANATGSVSQAEITEIKSIMEGIWRLQKSMLSRQPLTRR